MSSIATRRVVVTGMGCLTPIGNNANISWNNLINNVSGLMPLSNLPNYNTLFKQFDDIINPNIKIGYILNLLNNNNNNNNNPLFDNSSDDRKLNRFTKLALLASYEALTNANLLINNTSTNIVDTVNLNSFGCNIGTGIASINDIYDNSLLLSQINNNNKRKKISPFFIPKILSNMATGNVSIKFNLKGPSNSISNACATGNNSIGDAYNLIKLNKQDISIAGGTDSSIHPITITGFNRLKSLSLNNSSPFDNERSGFILSEGAGILIVEELNHALNRGVDKNNILAEIIGYGLSNDAYHITTPDINGDGAMRSINMAINEAINNNLLSLNDLNNIYINAHATSTKLGDQAELLAIKRSLLYNNNNNNSLNLFISSNKGSIGHLLGASGAVEAIFTINSLKFNKFPNTLNLKNSDQIENYFNNYETSKNNNSMTLIKDKPIKDIPINYALSNSFGFGGANTSILFKKWDPNNI